ncbi:MULTISPECIES: hypothetical protein [Brevibacillus]|uniref:hypothetical protein n=1 Tax=Brevibacillus TaxID=55080 RepID=UPI003628A898
MENETVVDGIIVIVIMVMRGRVKLLRNVMIGMRRKERNPRKSDVEVMNRSRSRRGKK